MGPAGNLEPTFDFPTVIADHLDKVNRKLKKQTSNLRSTKIAKYIAQNCKINTLNLNYF